MKQLRVITIVGWFLIILGAASVVANLVSLKVMQGKYMPTDETSRKYYVEQFKRLATVAEGLEGLRLHPDNLEIFRQHAIQSIFRACLYLLAGVGLVGGQEWGRRLCLSIAVVIPLWVSFDIWRLTSQGISLSLLILHRLYLFIGAIGITWWLTRSRVKAKFQT